MMTIIATFVLIFVTLIVRVVRKATRKVVDTGSYMGYMAKDAVKNPKYTAFSVRDSVLSKVYTWRSK